MTIITEWDNPQRTIIRLTLNNRWTWYEIREMRETAMSMLADVTHSEVHFIVDMRNADFLPENPLANFRRYSDIPLEKSGIVVIVGMGPKTRSIFNIFISVYRLLADRIRYMIADSLEEARAIIADEIAKNNLPD